MLRHLAIRNYATVHTLDMEFAAGMTAITGETGAGKSIILGALGFTLGDRADKTIVRSGCSRAEISAEFDTSQIDAARQWLGDHELLAEDDPDICLLRRVVGSDGRSRAFINGSAVNLSGLRTLGDLLINIHSQHEHQSLLHKSTHQKLLDDFGVDNELRTHLAATWSAWRQNQQQLLEMSQSREEDSAQSRLLTYQLSELDSLDVAEGEFAKLEAEFRTLNHAEDILDRSCRALHDLSAAEEGNLTDRLGAVISMLRDTPEQTGTISSALGLLENAQIQFDEAVHELRNFTDSFQADPERLQEVDRRLRELHDMARKHQVPPAELGRHMMALQSQLDRLENHGGEMARLEANDLSLREQFARLARDQSRQRKTAARKLSKLINVQLTALGMPHASLEVRLCPDNGDIPRSNGLESVEFLVTTNPGQPTQPLIRIASGGELSRISLAIQVITAQTSQTPCLVFDEVDVGISGGIARTVGELLRRLGEKTQILCVTHEAQVAGQGHHHCTVVKQSTAVSTQTSIRQLEIGERVRELARMLDGDDPSSESLAHAQHMLAGTGG